MGLLIILYLNTWKPSHSMQLQWIAVMNFIYYQYSSRFFIHTVGQSNMIFKRRVRLFQNDLSIRHNTHGPLPPNYLPSFPSLYVLYAGRYQSGPQSVSSDHPLCLRDCTWHVLISAAEHAYLSVPSGHLLLLQSCAYSSSKSIVSAEAQNPLDRL